MGKEEKGSRVVFREDEQPLLVLSSPGLRLGFRSPQFSMLDSNGNSILHRAEWILSSPRANTRVRLGIQIEERNITSFDFSSRRDISAVIPIYKRRATGSDVASPNPGNGSMVSQAKRKGSPCQRDDDSQGGEIELYSGPSLPE
ncbi:hypothetical protein ACP70R_028490 [Stipagrostis hirtigluma subsp. patula]